MSTRGRRKVELVAARMLSPSVRSLVVRFIDGAPFAFVACGLSPMVDDVVSLLEKRLGLDRGRVHYEIYD